MDHRLYFILGDLLINLVVGAIVGWFAWLIVGPQWNMFLAMWLMMIVGMLIALVAFIPASILFGAMEVMLATMFSGMLSGMVVGMWIPMSALNATQAMVYGGLAGLAGILIIWSMNARLRGIQSGHHS